MIQLKLNNNKVKNFDEHDGNVIITLKDIEMMKEIEFFFYKTNSIMTEKSMPHLFFGVKFSVYFDENLVTEAFWGPLTVGSKRKKGTNLSNCHFMY